MADQSITQLPVALSLTGDEQTVVVQNGVTKQASVTQIANAASPGKLITNSSYNPTTGYLTFYYSDGTTSAVGPIAGSSGGSGSSGYSGFSGYSGKSGYSGYSGSGLSGFSGFSGSGISGYSGAGFSGYSGYSGISGINGMGVSGYSGYSGGPGASGISGYSGSGISGYSGAGFSGYSGYSGAGFSGYSGYSGGLGASGYSGMSGYSGAGTSGFSGFSGYSGQTGAGGVVANYGKFYDTTTQTNAAGASGSNVITINNVTTSQGVSIVSSSRITFASTGTYLINLLGQFVSIGAGTDYKVFVWSALNGSNVTQSKFEFSTGGINGQVLANVQFVANVTAGDYYQFYWNSANTNMQLQPTAAGTSPTTPAAPSVDLIVAQITFTQSGFSGFSGYSGFSGAGTSGYSGYSGGSGGSGASGYSGSGISGYSGSGISGYSGYSGLGLSGYSGYSGGPGASGTSGYSGSGLSGFSGISGYSGATGASGYSGYSGWSGISGVSGYSGATGPSTTINATNSATNAKYYLVGLPALGSNQTAYGFSGNELTYNPATGDLESYHVNATGNIASAANRGAFSYGTLDYSDTNIMASFAANIDTYAQVILQNINDGTQASVDLIVSGSSGSATSFYGDFGINSTGFSAAGSFGLPNATYLYSHGGDLVLGTQTSNSLRLVTNNSTVDAVTINTANAIAVNGSFGTSGYILQTNGSGYAPTWVVNSGGGGGGTPGGSTTQAQYNNAGSFGGILNVTVKSGQTTARIDPRVLIGSNSATSVTPDISQYDMYVWEALSTAGTLTINVPTGIPLVGNTLMFRIQDDGSTGAVTLSWNAIFRQINVPIPTTTGGAGKVTYVGCIYNTSSSTWDVIASGTQF